MDELEEQPTSLINFDVVLDGNRRATVLIKGELDISGVDPLAARVDEVLGGGVTSLTVDVAGVRFADSSAIALWVRWAGAVDEFELREPPPLLRRVIGAMGLTQKLGAPS
ncbi:MAG: lipid asymmetry maintenance protein MlaB [Solirubrobacteraceae bacterium]